MHLLHFWVLCVSTLLTDYGFLPSYEPCRNYKSKKNGVGVCKKQQIENTMYFVLPKISPVLEDV